MKELQARRYLETMRENSKPNSLMLDICDYMENIIAELESHKQVIADCITLLAVSGSNTKEQVLEKLRGLVE